MVAVSDRVIASLLAEPAVEDPPRRVWRDYALVALVAGGAAIESATRQNLVWRPWSAIVVILLSLTLLWRRQHPLAMMTIAMGGLVVADQAALAIEGSPLEVYASAFLLIHVYALFRWGSGRQCALGLLVMAATFVSGLITSWTGLADAIAGAVVLVFPGVLGAEVRHLTQRRARERQAVKARERELLARELHDTVAHHVSAIAIQAQAGRVVGPGDPDAALDALAVIEHEASKTLTEMRTIVAKLRDDSVDDQTVEYAPQAGIADIASLAESAAASGPPVHIMMSGLDDVGSTVGATLYRLAQESITNARRHATGASQIRVSINADGQFVRLAVVDDGAPRHAESSLNHGFGLLGMTERAELLGGTLHAGPDATRGWRVDASIPLDGAST